MKKAAFSLLMMLFFTSLSAQWSTNPAINNAIADLPGEQAIPKVAVCSDGSIYIAFLSNQTGNYTVRLQRLDSQGNELWAHNGILISDQATDSWVTDWDMTADGSNHAVLVYNDIRNGNMNVYAWRVSPTGSQVWGASGVTLSNNSAFNAAPKVTVTQAGNAIFAWQSDDVIIMQKVNPAGTKQWGDAGITLTSVNSLSWPQMLPVGTDDFILKYFDDAGNPPYPTRLVYAQRYNSAGAPVWSVPALISDAGGISSWTQIFPFINDGSDGFYIAWHDDRDNNMLASTWVQHVNSSGQVVFAADGVEASTQTGRNHYYPQLSHPQGSSDVYVFWTEMNGDQNLNGINGQKISAAGTRQWGESGITFIALSSASVVTEAASQTNTDMVLMYSLGDAVNSQLKAMKVNSAGNYVWPTQHITISSVASSKVHVEMGKYASDQWVVAWEDNRNGNVDIFAQNFSVEGTLGPYELTFGTIQGNVALNGGTGNVTQVVVSAGSISTLPDPTGDYILTVPTGTWDVTATLNGYYPETVTGVVVIEDQSTNGVDFTLNPIPTTGYLQGTVTLAEGNGDVTQTIVTAGNISTSPDAGGFYSMEVGVGSWDVTAQLEGYSSQTLGNVTVDPGLTTQGVDFLLYLLPQTGFLYGNVSIEDNLADVVLATVTSGTQSVHPDNYGDFLIELPVGQQTVTASHPYTETETTEVTILPGGSTGQDFDLTMLRRDMVCKIYMWPGNSPLNESTAIITGPGDMVLTDIQTNDSIIFPQVPFGHYIGTAHWQNTYFEHDTSHAVIDQLNNLIEISILFESAKNYDIQELKISPNPVSANDFISFGSDIPQQGILTVSDPSGKKISEISLKTSGMLKIPVTLLLNQQKPAKGVYYLHFVSGKQLFTGKLLIRN